MEIGIDRLTIKVVLIRLKNTYNTITANNIPNTAESFTSPIDAPIKSP
ncbi:unknown [Odoribacter sp. CAG:788]|nr:unknown [Odoribacter sp. CAG:788]